MRVYSCRFHPSAVLTLLAGFVLQATQRSSDRLTSTRRDSGIEPHISNRVSLLAGASPTRGLRRENVPDIRLGRPVFLVYGGGVSVIAITSSSILLRDHRPNHGHNSGSLFWSELRCLGRPVHVAVVLAAATGELPHLAAVTVEHGVRDRGDRLRRGSTFAVDEPLGGLG